MTAEPESNAEQDGVTASGLFCRIAAFDVGDKRIGMALSDPLGNAHPLLTIFRKTPRADLKSIGRLLRKYEVAEAVVGNPLNMSGEAGPRAHKTQLFAEELRAAFGLPVHLVDERLTTQEAHALLNQTDGRPRKPSDRRERSRMVDQVAAVLILEGFLQARSHAAARRVAEQMKDSGQTRRGEALTSILP